MFPNIFDSIIWILILDNNFFQAYVIFVQNMGGVWLERNMTTFLTHVLDLVANPKAASSHVDAVYSRHVQHYVYLWKKIIKNIIYNLSQSVRFIMKK